ncbi:MAG: hypothetical protein U1E59_20450 [Amaricoccus sp.]
MLRLAPLLALAGAPAFAQEPPAYVDDRSDGAALVRSYYNAIERQEYARAWSYFGDEKPVKDFATFAAGYADTATIELRTGAVEPEGAAGSIYQSVPVAFSATGADGKVAVFSGCYVTRLLQPANQEPPFAPLHIESAKLHAASGTLEAALPKDCGD